MSPLESFSVCLIRRSLSPIFEQKNGGSEYIELTNKSKSISLDKHITPERIERGCGCMASESNLFEILSQPCVMHSLGNRFLSHTIFSRADSKHSSSHSRISMNFGVFRSFSLKR